MTQEEFPSFKKAEKKTELPKKPFATGLLLIASILLVALGIFLSFRFLVGSKTPRSEILAQVLSASPSRQASLLMEWMQNIDQSSHQKMELEWKPSAFEQRELLSFAAAKVSELETTRNSPALYALHVASWGPALADSKDLDLVASASLKSEGLLAVGLFYLRQKDFSQKALERLNALSESSNEALRKVAGAYFAQCAGAAFPSALECSKSALRLLEDANDEVRWNIALGILRESTSVASLFSESDKALAAREIGKLYVLIKSGDPTLLSRFQGQALESLAGEVFKAELLLNPAQTRADLKLLSSTHPDLRIRNLARNFESNF